VTPDKVQARKMVLVSIFLLSVIAVYRDRKQGTNDTFRALWGVGVLSMFLSLAADFIPTVAGPFAVLTVLGSLSTGGNKALQQLFTVLIPGSNTAGAAAGAAVGSQTTTRTGPSTQTTVTKSAGTTTVAHQTGP